MFLSIVVPLYNEQESVRLLFHSILEITKKLGREYEIVFVDDGSTDKTLEELLHVKNEDDHVKVIALRKNFGQTASMSAGFDYAQGEIIVAMDGDLQNDPSDIPKLLQGIEDGYDIVSGWRINRKDKLVFRKVPSMIANWMISIITGVKLHDYGCSLKAYRADVIKSIKLYGEMHRFIPALASWNGAKILEVPVKHNPREFGESKYGLWRTFRVVLDLLTVKFMLSFFTKPLHMLGFWGIISIAAGLGYGFFLTFQRLILHVYIKPLRPLIVLLLVISGIQLLTIGLVAEINIRTYYESQGKPIYAIKKIYE
ncbi:MAG: glycosyltransferase family 2 protein [Thermodesulfobacteriota bacterium]|nr:glycosyltransferase family 2 protein [Thermodesulfobacteriota bacterium]